LEQFLYHFCEQLQDLEIFAKAWSFDVMSVFPPCKSKRTNTSAVHVDTGHSALIKFFFIKV